MRIGVIGTVKFSGAMLRRLLELRSVSVSAIVTRETAGSHSDFLSLAPLASEKSIPCFLADNAGGLDMASWLRGQSLDAVFCVGWSRLLGPAILESSRLGIIGYHPALLPRNRGRHPIIWALALGLSETGSTFFMMDQGADSGDIVSQRAVPIAAEDDAATLYARIEATAGDQITDMAEHLDDLHRRRVPQDASRASHWRKRSAADGLIDWRMPASGIHNLVRALAHPYPGAHCRHGDQDIKIWSSSILLDAPTDVEPGRVLTIRGRRIAVKCGLGALELVNHEFPEIPAVGDCL